MTRHLASEGVTLRNVLDYTLLLYYDGDNIDWQSTVFVLKEANMECTYDTIVGLCEKVLENDFSRYYIAKPDPKMVDKVFNEVLNVQLHTESKFETRKRVWEKTKRLFSRKWMYDCGLLPDKFWSEVVLGSIRDHIKHPKYW